ncbi:MAG: type II restriction enzyme [Saprospiraceae bacterium]
MTKNNLHWNRIFHDLSVLQELVGSETFKISSQQINRYRESRLMAKFDHQSQLPQIFKDNGLSILPVTRGDYLIGRFSTFEKLSYDHRTVEERASLPPHIHTIDPTNIYSESAALNCAFTSGMLTELVGEDVMPTVSGRMSTSDFEFKIKGASQPLSVRNSQCEIDGGFEGEHSLLLLEAKNQRIDDFNIRQIYYPYRLWSGKIHKKIVPALLTFSNDVFSFFIYEFTDQSDFNSIQLVQQRNFSLVNETVTMRDVQEILDTTVIVPEPETPFPQADSFERVIDLMGLLANAGTLPYDFLTENYDFADRQTSYYVAAGRYLGLVDSLGARQAALTSKGQKLMQSTFKEKNMGFIRSILSHEVFNRCMKLYLEKAAPLSQEEIVGIMRDCSLRGIDSPVTYGRRAQTIRAWLDWIVTICE